MKAQIDLIRSSYERRLMDLEENLTNEQLKCKEVVRARC